MNHFNKLDPRTHEELSVLFEELAEATQVVGKIMRHGLLSCHPSDVKREFPNSHLLAVELGHVKYAVDKLVKNGVIELSVIRRSAKTKSQAILQYLHHQ